MLIEEEVSRFQRRLQSLDAVPTIVALQDRIERIRQAEVERLRGRLGSLTVEQQTAVENLTRSIVNKILHSPISALKGASGSEQLTATAELLRNVFGIDDETVRRNGTSAEAKESRRPSTKLIEESQSSSPDPGDVETTIPKSNVRN
jgi:glutamyl-tRNA reductase